MDEKELINRIRALKKIQPDEAWVISCRAQITRRVESAGEATNWKSRIAEVFSFNQPLFQPAVISLVAFVILAGIGGLAIFNAQGSLPGENAFLLKVFAEKAQWQYTALVADETAQVKLGAEMTDRRAQELAQIMDSSSAPQDDQVKQAVDQIQLQVASAKENVSKLKEQIGAQNGNPRKIAEAAMAVRDSNAKVKEIMAQAQSSLSENLSEDKALASKISDISDITSETNDRVTEIIDSVELMKGDVGVGEQTATTSEKAGVPEIETTTPELLP
ncbi:MAG: hypothetical protein COY11_00330 [Candidatus Portnoybacteria bacterium CG_4_10_14_0_2_um_filter_44_20]|uniref:DUF5667 domain-containing protein n=1 Tax=Candidatus Portnoybacteria bacterium CG_4_10_14_0_2_um_filter_44_20 TaxID=1974799 RepID=A0A2M7ULH5_9BACT|nr:MAG: hypothetical protein COY11_00330 [Candidatus Portnoybacteria bacterium CG_4_10_14_0_2_um_filter_44_20]